MNKEQKEQYLREYSVLKSQGKPFFPYAVAKDSGMAVVVMIVIILMSLIAGRRAGPEGRPDDDDLHAAARVVLLLPLRAAARDQAGRADAAGDDRRADDLHDPAVPAAVLRPRPGAPARAAPDRHHRRHLHDLRDGLPDLPGRERRSADRDRPQDARARQGDGPADGRPVREGQAGGGAVGLPGLSQDRRERRHARAPSSPRSPTACPRRRSRGRS